MKAQTSDDSFGSVSSTVASTPETASITDSDATTEGTTLNGNGSEGQPSSVAVKSDSSKGKGKNTESTSNAASKSKSSTDNLIGKLNNLVTTDLQNIVDGRDFVMLSRTLPRFTLDIWTHAFCSRPVSIDGRHRHWSFVQIPGLEVSPRRYQAALIILTGVQRFRRLSYYAFTLPYPGLCGEAHADSTTRKNEEGRSA